MHKSEIDAEVCQAECCQSPVTNMLKSGKLLLQFGIFLFAISHVHFLHKFAGSLAGLGRNEGKFVLAQTCYSQIAFFHTQYILG